MNKKKVSISKKLLSLALAVLLCFSLAFPAFASYEETHDSNGLQEKTIELEGRSITYKYRQENGQTVYAEVDDDVIERIGDEVFVNGEKVATITTTILYQSDAAKRDVVNSSLINNALTPRSGWMWSPNGNDNDYYVSIYETRMRNIALERAIAACTVEIIAILLQEFLPVQNIVLDIALEIIENVAGAYKDYYMSTELYSLETTYQHKYLGISYAKKINYKYSYNRAFTHQVPNTEIDMYGFWG